MTCNAGPFRAVVILLASIVGACGRADDSNGSPTTAPQTARVEAQVASANPCAWIQRESVERILGRLAAEPLRVSSAERLEADAEGTGCLLRPMHSLDGQAETPYELGVEVVVDGALEIATALGSTLPGLGQGLTATTGAGQSSAHGSWDWTGGVPGMHAVRRGHVLILFGDNAPWLGTERLDSVGAQILAAMKDLPFAQSASDLDAAATGRDPCTLLTAAEGSDLLGSLPVPPFRSRESSPLAHANGPSCTWYLGDHRVLVITPTWTDGEMMFRMLAGATAFTGRVLINEEATDTLEGSWDQMTTGVDGSLYFLKGDEMLAVQHGLSGLTMDVVIRVARAAADRM